jgi:hypothetical protein
MMEDNITLSLSESQLQQQHQQQQQQQTELLSRACDDINKEDEADVDQVRVQVQVQLVNQQDTHTVRRDGVESNAASNADSESDSKQNYGHLTCSGSESDAVDTKRLSLTCRATTTTTTTAAAAADAVGTDNTILIDNASSRPSVPRLQLSLPAAAAAPGPGHGDSQITELVSDTVTSSMSTMDQDVVTSVGMPPEILEKVKRLNDEELQLVRLLDRSCDMCNSFTLNNVQPRNSFLFYYFLQVMGQVLMSVIIMVPSDSIVVALILCRC